MPTKPKTKRPAPVRSEDNTTFSWSLSKELKAALFLIADKEGRTVSNYLTRILTPQADTTLKGMGVVLTPELIEETLSTMRNQGYRT